MTQESQVQNERKLKTQVQASPKRSIWSKLKMLTCYIRGYITSFRFEKRAIWTQHGKLKITKVHGKIHMGNRVVMYPNVKISCIGTPEREAEIIFHDWAGIGNDVEFHTGTRIEIGRNTAISWHTTLLGSDYHSAGAKGRGVADIVIEDDAWIGCRCLILKGVTVGKGAIVGAGSVVTKDVPPHTLVAGNPARIIKENIEPWKTE